MSKMCGFKLIVVVSLIAVFDSGLSLERYGIVGGDLTTVQEYPYIASLLYSSDLVSYAQRCSGAVINNRAVVSAANCFLNHVADSWRIRIGSTYANSGGSLHSTQRIINHVSYSPYTLDHDIAILHSNTEFQNSNVSPGAIAGPNYNLVDNTGLLAVGWGSESFSSGASATEQLRHLQVNYITNSNCRNIYVEIAMYPSDDMLCSGWIGASGRPDHCQGNSGGPVTHNKVIVGITSWGEQCGLPKYPGVSTRVSSYTSWIQENA